jgi:predicted ATP-grasp superfamily ATP-dependent carboligase
MQIGNMKSQSIIIVGASTRAAAFSALAGGLSPICADQFADADLALRCGVSPVTVYPEGFEPFVRHVPGQAWMYTGALENYLALVARLAAHKTLWGNNPLVLARARDPLTVHRLLGAAGLASPQIQQTADLLRRDGTWLRKLRRSSGGLGVSIWDAGAEKAADDHYFQRFVSGDSCAAIYVSSPDGQTRFLGATEQLLRPAPGSVRPFRYVGSVGPLRLDDRAAQTLVKIGQALTSGLGLVGVWGVDYIDDGRDIWPIEVNPRYTASVEILERSLAFSAVARHVAACRDGILFKEQPLSPHALWHGKRIIYAVHDVDIDRAFVERSLTENAGGTMPTIADIPTAGTSIKQGRPVMTVFAQAVTRDDVVVELERVAQDWQRRLSEGVTV